MAQLHLDQVRRVPGLSFTCQTRVDLGRSPAAEQEFHHDRGVKDDQCRSLSCRNVDTMDARAATGRNFDSRARISLGAGRRLVRSSSASK